jgi:hypothetical protein
VCTGAAFFVCGYVAGAEVAARGCWRIGCCWTPWGNRAASGGAYHCGGRSSFGLYRGLGVVVFFVQLALERGVTSDPLLTLRRRDLGAAIAWLDASGLTLLRRDLGAAVAGSDAIGYINSVAMLVRF